MENIVVSFELLVGNIRQTHEELAAQASRAVNVSLTLRNWLIGFHIAEYEQKGSDRAQYGDRLLERLSESLVEAGVSRSEERELRRYRLFYATYPQIRDPLGPELKERLLPLKCRRSAQFGTQWVPNWMRRRYRMTIKELEQLWTQ